MGSTELNIHLRNGSHTDLVKSSGEKSSESRTEGNPSSGTETGGNTNNVLFSDETFDKSFREFFSEDSSHGGVLGITIQSDDEFTFISVAEGLQSVTIGISGSNSFTQFVVSGGDFELGMLSKRFGIILGLGGGHRGISILQTSLQTSQSGVTLGTERLSVPVHLIFNGVSHGFTLKSFGNDSNRLIFDSLGLFESIANLLQVMPINNNGMPSEGFTSLLIDVSSMFQTSGIGLSKTVNIKDTNQVIQGIDTGEVHGFPDGALGRFTITQDAIVSKETKL
mmetsp:Transcript_4592/g.5188  ORF Transcript_4592/g.5188 Transcript_4592/m.5188 type:complete len:280 (+) Transcript_4592:160-999(+)